MNIDEIKKRIKEIYENMDARRTKIAWTIKDEQEAVQERKEALIYVMEELKALYSEVEGAA